VPSPPWATKSYGEDKMIPDRYIRMRHYATEVVDELRTRDGNNDWEMVNDGHGMCVQTPEGLLFALNMVDEHRADGGTIYARPLHDRELIPGGHQVTDEWWRHHMGTNNEHRVKVGGKTQPRALAIKILNEMPAYHQRIADLAQELDTTLGMQQRAEEIGAKIIAAGGDNMTKHTHPWARWTPNDKHETWMAFTTPDSAGKVKLHGELPDDAVIAVLNALNAWARNQ
jgi:hypothetical protein